MGGSRHWYLAPQWNYCSATRLKREGREKECDWGLSNISVEKIMFEYLDLPHGLP